MNYSDVRLTDALERQLLQEAMDRQHDYALDRALKHLAGKIARVFKNHVSPVAHTMRTAP